jgi:murein L,D-transpeptidase YafK
VKKRLKKKYRKILIFAPLSILIVTISILFITKERPPVEEIKIARQKLTEAKIANAQSYSKKLFYSASAAYDSAMHYWSIENEKFYLFRKYDKVKFFALKSAKYATSSTNQADNNSKNIKKEVEDKIKRTQRKIDIFQANFDKMPQVDDVRKQYNKGKILFGEAKLAFQKSDYINAQQKVDVASKLIEKSFNHANNILVNYFGNYPKWQQWVNSTINQSRINDSYCIIIDKFSRECLLYYKGVLKEKFEIDLGKNWIGTKNHQGDYTTPEGKYKVVDKKNNGRTQYYKALLINYPNDEDKARFAQNKKNGSIPARKRIGDLIEIHGDGGKGADWTQGCVALANQDIDRLFSRCPVGTSVTIVGSLKPLSEIMKLP